MNNVICVSLDCRPFGGKYRGTIKITSSGEKCQRWDKQFPHQHSFNDKTKFPDGSTEHSYCRSPDGNEKPWCYTTNHTIRKQYCDIPYCGLFLLFLKNFNLD